MENKSEALELWQKPEFKTFEEKPGVNTDNVGIVSWKTYAIIMMIGGGALGVLGAICGDGDGIIYSLSAIAMGVLLGWLSEIVFESLFKSKGVKLSFFAALYLIPPIIAATLGFVAGFIKIALIVIVILVVLSLLGS